MNASTPIYRQRINTAIDYINKNIYRPVSLDELACVSLFSPFHFHRIFTAVTGETVHQFTNRVRLEHATKMVRFSNKTIAHIAHECGYSSPATLTRAFKQYFEMTPSAFRKSKKIENSKIRKELYPVSEYHCDMDEAELKTRFPVEICHLDQRHIACIRVKNSFEDGVVVRAFDRLIRWAKKMDVFDTGIIFGMSKDDPTITPKDKYIYDVCITVPKEFQERNHKEIEIKWLDRCQYAKTTVSGDFNTAATAIHFLFNTWLVNSDYEPDHRAGMEIFRDKSKVTDWTHLDLELYIPVKAIKAV